MIVVVDNLGPVRHAEIDLGKRLIVFAGPNHSGKTHVAWTVYGLLSRLQAFPTRLSPAAVSIAAELLDAAEAGIPIQRYADFGREYIQQGLGAFVDSLPIYFAANKELFRSARLDLTFLDADLTGLLHGQVIRFAATSGDIEFAGIEGLTEPTIRLEVVPEARLGNSLGLTGRSDAVRTAQESSNAERILQEVAPMLAWLVGFRLLGTDAVIFPTERTAVSLFSRELASSRFGLVDEILKTSGDPAEAMRLATRSARRYPGPILECIQDANDLAERSRVTTELEPFAVELEAILGGRMDVSAEGEIGFTLAEPGCPRVPFHISASVVKSLASLVFYFRHQARPGATLVIDEPELNLHPDLQRKVARFLAKAVNAGFRIILSTHSDYVLREFSNLVRLGAAGERGTEVATELGYDPASTLKPELVGVWHFANGEAESIKINGDGFNLSSIEDVIGQQNMDSERIEFAVGK